MIIKNFFNLNKNNTNTLALNENKKEDYQNIINPFIMNKENPSFNRKPENLNNNNVIQIIENNQYMQKDSKNINILQCVENKIIENNINENIEKKPNELILQTQYNKLIDENKIIENNLNEKKEFKNN